MSLMLTNSICAMAAAGGTTVSDYAVASNDPDLVCDFVSEFYAKEGGNSTFSGVLSFSRTGSAWYFNSSGVFTEATSGNARVGHHEWNGSSWVDKGLLLESAARENLDPNSDDLSAWTTSNTTIAKDQTGAAGNANEAHSITADANNGTALEQITAASADHVWSCLMKRITGSGTVEVTVDGGTTWVDVTSDIDSSEFVQVSTGAGATVTNPEFGVRLGTSGDAVAVQNSQLEQTSQQCSSPIPTTGTTVTRNAETLTSPAANHTPSTTALSWHLKGELDYADTNQAQEVLQFLWEADANNYVRATIKTSSARSGQLTFQQKESVSGFDENNTGNNYFFPGRRVAMNMAGRHTSGAIQGAEGGTSITANTTPTALADLSAADIDLTNNNFMGTINILRVWQDVDLGQSGIETASTY